MKLFFSITVLSLLTACVSEKKFADNVIKTRLPKVPWMFPAKDSAELIARYRNGIIMYKENCSGCHGVFGKPKDSIPDFSIVELHNYKTSFLAGDKKNHAVMAKMTETEMNNVLRFLIDLKR